MGVRAAVAVDLPHTFSRRKEPYITVCQAFSRTSMGQVRAAGGNARRPDGRLAAQISGPKADDVDNLGDGLPIDRTTD